METHAIARAGGAQQAVKPAAEKTYFSDVRNFTELFQRIDSHGPFKGTAKEYSPEEIKEIISEVMRGETGIQFVTRVDGLRYAVTKLLALVERVDIEAIGRSEGLDVLKRAEIHGERFYGKELTTALLEREGLEPAHKVKVGEVSVWFSSSAYGLDGGRMAVVAYIETEDKKIVARSYYRSNSAGLWRYLPAYVEDGRGGIQWYSKGYGEESITLPIPVQRALAEITKLGMPILQVRDPGLIFAGTCRCVEEPRTYIEEVSKDPKELIPAVKNMGGNFHSIEHDKVPPEQVKPANSEDAADFLKLVMSWKQDTNLYGKISVDVFESRNGTYRYMFCRDWRGRAWIGGIEDDSEIKSVGLKSNWIWAGDLTTPAFEYESQAGGYGNPSLRNGPYVDMFKNYLSKVPMIQEYLAWTNRTIIMRL